VFRRALERGNLLVAEATAREVGHVHLSEALELTALTALHDRARGGRLAIRWLQRWLDESRPRTVDEAALVATLLAALGGDGHHAALLALRAVVEMPTAKASPSHRARHRAGVADSDIVLDDGG
jgi:hypothetical protein